MEMLLMRGEVFELEILYRGFYFLANYAGGQL